MNRYIICCAFSIMALLSCRAEGRKGGSVPVDGVAITIPYDTARSYIADYLAGMYDAASMGDDGAKLVYQRHQAEIGTLFSEAQTNNIKAIEAWAQLRLPEGQTGDYTLLYPFSGPDFYNAYYLFPAAKTYIMFGLEPVGELPSVKSLNDSLFLKSIRYSMRTLVAKNFYVTGEMDKDYRSKKEIGIATMLMVFAARTEHKITQVSYMLIGSNGSATECSTASEMLKGQGAKAIKMELLDKQGNVQTIIYASFDAENSKISVATGIGKYLSSIPDKTYGLLKAASYLLHYDSFSTMRGIVTSKCDLIMTDDSGLPFNVMQKNYKVQLFGEYSKPISEFKFIDLSLLKAAYDKGEALPLPFKFGYGQGKKVMLGRKES